MSARLSSLVILLGLVAGGLVLQTAIDEDPVAAPLAVDAGVAIPAARAEPTLSSTWFCAAGTAYEDGFADHVLLITNPSERDREVTITALTGEVAVSPPLDDGTSTTTSTTSTTVATSTTVRPDPPQATIELPAQSRVSYRLGGLVEAQLAGAVVEVEGGEIAVEHELTGDLGRATAPCSTTASASWSFPWGVTARGARELLVFMNPFPDDATVDITFATDEGIRDTLRFQGFVVPGRSVVGAYIDEDVTRRAQVSAKVQVRGGRLVVDRLQSFDGTDGREGMTVGLGAPAPALTWMFPDGLVSSGIAEQVVVFNPSDGVAEVEVEVRLDDPATNGIPEPFDLTVRPDSYAIVDVHAEDRIPRDVPHSILVRSLNSVPIVAERVLAATEGAPRRGIGATLGSPIGAPTWYFPGGGTTAERDEFITILNVSNEQPVTVSLVALANGQRLFVEGVQDIEIDPGARRSIRLGDHVEREDLPIVVLSDGPIVAERGLYRVGGQGMSQAMGIPLAEGVVVPDAIDGSIGDESDDADEPLDLDDDPLDDDPAVTEPVDTSATETTETTEPTETTGTTTASTDTTATTAASPPGSG